MAAPRRARVSPQRIVVVLLAASAVLVAASGCGGGGSEDRLTKEEYLEEFKSIGTDLDAGMQELFDAEPDSSDFGAIADQVEALGGGFDELVGRVEELNPPEEIGASHDKLLAGLDEFAGWAHDLADKIRTAPAAELVALLEEYGLNDGDITKIPGAAKIQEAVEELGEKGYSLSGDSETYATEGPGDAEAGRAVFHSAGCGSCHTLAHAPAAGTIGPDLDFARPPYGKVVERVTNGQGIMPPFGSQLSEKQIQDVAAYVSSVAGG